MPDILHDFPVFAAPKAVFDALTTPSGLNTWWTLTAEGVPEIGTTYHLGFGPSTTWHVTVTACTADAAIEWVFTKADADWQGTKLGFRLQGKGDRTQVQFYHTGWPEANAHFRGSSFCWAMYLRLMKRYVEFGEVVPYSERLSV